MKDVLIQNGPPPGHETINPCEHCGIEIKETKATAGFYINQAPVCIRCFEFYWDGNLTSESGV